MCELFLRLLLDVLLVPDLRTYVFSMMLTSTIGMVCLCFATAQAADVQASVQLNDEGTTLVVSAPEAVLVEPRLALEGFSDVQVDA